MKRVNDYFLNITSTFKSKYSKEIHEFLSEYKRRGALAISVEELKYRLSLIDSKTGRDKYPGWPMFTKQILEIPQKELVEHSDITFIYTPKKTGRKYTDIEFTILPSSKKEVNYEGGLFEARE